MKTVLLLAGMIWGLASSAMAKDIKDVGESKYELSVGDLSMVVDAAHGGKVLSFKHKDKEVISQSRWPESFGSTFWTSPQKEWNWPPVPEYDKNADVVELCLCLSGECNCHHGNHHKYLFHCFGFFVIN